MSSKKVSVFLLPHGSIDARFERVRPKDPEHPADEESPTIYDFSIHCEDLPENTRLCMPNILGKPYYENRGNMIRFINNKIREWNESPQPAEFHGRSRSRSPEPKKDSFSDFIAQTLTRFEEEIGRVHV